MPKHRCIQLTAQQEQELIEQRDHAAQPYLRERCAAILKIAGGLKPAQVARSYLLKPHEPDTIYTWLDRSQREGLIGLKIRQGRGRKPAFSPCSAQR